MKFKSLLWFFFAFYSCQELNDQNSLSSYNNQEEDFLTQAKKAFEQAPLHPSFKNINWDELLLGYPVLNSLGDQYLNFRIESDPLDKKEPLCTILTFIKRKDSNQIEIHPWRAETKKEGNQSKAFFRFYTLDGTSSRDYTVENWQQYPIKGKLVRGPSYNSYNQKPTLYNGNNESRTQYISYEDDLDEVTIRRSRGSQQQAVFYPAGGFGGGGFGMRAAMQNQAMYALHRQRMEEQRIILEAQRQAREEEARKDREETERFVAKAKKKIKDFEKLEESIDLITKLKLKNEIDSIINSAFKINAGDRVEIPIHIRGEIDPPYKLIDRDFIAQKLLFAYTFYGDDRGFSTDSDATARIHHIKFIDKDYKLSTEAYSDLTKLNLYNPLSYIMFPHKLKDNAAIPKSEITKDLKIKVNGEEKILHFSTHVEAKNPKFPQWLAPAIESSTEYKIIEQKNGNFRIQGQIKGNRYPSKELILEDPSGNPAIIAQGFYRGTPSSSLSEKEKEIATFDIGITVDEKGNYVSFEENGITLSREKWNEAKLKENPHRDKNRSVYEN